MCNVPRNAQWSPGGCRGWCRFNVSDQMELWARGKTAPLGGGSSVWGLAVRGASQLANRSHTPPVRLWPEVDLHTHTHQRGILASILVLNLATSSNRSKLKTLLLVNASLLCCFQLAWHLGPLISVDWSPTQLTKVLWTNFVQDNSYLDRPVCDGNVFKVEWRRQLQWWLLVGTTAPLRMVVTLRWQIHRHWRKETSPILMHIYEEKILTWEHYCAVKSTFCR